MSTLLKTNRRDFLKLAAATSGGLLLGFHWTSAEASAMGVVDEAVTDPGAGRERGQVAGHHAVQVAVDPGVDLALDDIDELFLVLLGVGP